MLMIYCSGSVACRLLILLYLSFSPSGLSCQFDLRKITHHTAFMGRSPCCEKIGLKKGPWTPEEDQKLLAFIEEHGHGSWRALPEAGHQEGQVQLARRADHHPASCSFRQQVSTSEISQLQIVTVVIPLKCSELILWLMYLIWHLSAKAKWTVCSCQTAACHLVTIHKIYTWASVTPLNEGRKGNHDPMK